MKEGINFIPSKRQQIIAYKAWWQGWQYFWLSPSPAKWHGPYDKEADCLMAAETAYALNEA